MPCQQPVGTGQRTTEAGTGPGWEGARNPQPEPPEFGTVEGRRFADSRFSIRHFLPPHGQEEYRYDHVTRDAHGADPAETAHAGVGGEGERAKAGAGGATAKQKRAAHRPISHLHVAVVAA